MKWAERQAFTAEVSRFRLLIKGIYDRLPQLERAEIAPFLSAFDYAKEMVRAVRDRSIAKKASAPLRLPCGHLLTHLGHIAKP